jgi:arylsulfate sulfotransferase
MKKLVIVPVLAILALSVLPQASLCFADVLYVDTGSGISLFDINDVLGGGTSPTGSFGPSGAVTGFSDPQGNVWIVTYNAGVSTVQKYDGAGDPIAGDVFQVAAPLQNGAVAGGNIFLSSASGEVYEYSSNTLTQITSWNIATGNSNLAGQPTNYTAIGIATDGSNIFTTEGDEGSFIDEWSASGALDSSVDVGIYGLYGLGLDGGNFFAGYTGDLLEFDTSGDYENAFAIGGANYSLSAGVAPATLTAVPEPGAVPLFLLTAFIAVMWLLARRLRGSMALTKMLAQAIRTAAWAIPFLALPAVYGQISLQINPSASSALIGQTITVSASASDPSNSGATFTYQFNVQPPGRSNFWLIRDYSPTNSFPFVTTGSEGVYVIQVIALESNGSTTSGTTPLTFTPVATTVPVVSATAHPLVAMYSLPPCPVGSLARVHFRLAGTIFWNYTPYQNCTGNTSLNFLIGGMRASSTYTLQHDLVNGPTDTLGPLMSFTTQAIPQSALNAIPSYSITVPATGPNATAYPVLLTTPTSLVSNTPLTPFAIDTQGKVIWYLPDFTSLLQVGGYMTHPVPGGTFLLIASDLGRGDKQLLRAYDVAGNLLRETDATAIANELAAMGKDRITSISHEIFRFPNGDTGFIGTVEKMLASAYDSNTNTVHSNVDVLGDMAVVLDSNFHVKWSWDEFNYAADFSTKKPDGSALPAYTGMLNEICTAGAGCPTLLNTNPSNGQKYTVANDWTHSNSLAPTPDGNLIISLRHQDMVIKINYSNGGGDGRILWRLGPEGDFTSSVPAGQTAFQFFNTHQHDAEYESNGLLSLFDNGNTRVSVYGGDSRGMAWGIDEAAMTATPVVNVDLGAYSLATGSAQRLANNNYHFYLGFINATNSQSVETTTTGTDEFKLSQPNTVGYRSFRMNTLYSVAGSVVYTPFYATPPGN